MREVSAAKGVVALLAAAALYALTSVLIRLLNAELDPFSQVAFRGFLGFIIVMVVLRPKLRELVAPSVPPSALVAYLLSFPVSILFFTFAVLETDINTAIFGLIAASLVGSFAISRLVFGTPIRTLTALGLLLSLVAVGIVTYRDGRGTADTSGLALAALSGAGEALLNAMRKRLGSELSYGTLAAVQLAMLTVVGSVSSLWFSHSFVLPSQWETWVAGVAFALALISISALTVYGFKHSDLDVGSIVLSSELVFGSVYGAVLFGEALTPQQVLGSALLLSSIVIVHMKRGPKGRETRSTPALSEIE